MPIVDFIRPIQVGAALSTLDLGFNKDNIGENISDQNPLFCELTALYWIWKNIDILEFEYIGLSHYRRYFIEMNFSQKLRQILKNRKLINPHKYVKKIEQLNFNEFLNDQLKNKLLKHLVEGNIILPKSVKLVRKGHRNIKDQYAKCHISKDWELMKRIVLERYPEYQESIKAMEGKHYLHAFNMFIADKAFIKSYCTWLFDILFKIEKEITLGNNAYQNRVLGFLAERLLNLYVWHHKYPIKEFPIIHIT